MTAASWTGRAAPALLAACALLVGCLPKESLTRRDEVEADRYALVLDMDVRTDGLDLAPFRWHVEGTVAWSYTRTFRDGSMGHLVRFEGMSSAISREGGAATAVPTPLEGAFVEVRSFPDGQLLALSGASPWNGAGASLEVLDVLWPALSPHLPGSKAEAAAPFVTSWPTWVEGGPKVRTRLEASWTPTPMGGWSYTGTLDGQGGYVAVSGGADGQVALGKDDTRLLSHTFDWTREVRTTWMGGRVITQAQHIVGSLRHIGREPAPPLDMPVTSDDVAADARALHLRDGRRVEDRPVDLASGLPFLLFPGDLSAAEQDALRAEVAGAGSM